MFDLYGNDRAGDRRLGGIGSAIAKGLAAQGARLAVSGSNVEKLEAFRAGLGGDHVALPCNLSDGAAVDALVPQAVEALGKLDILVNNAGVTRDNLAMRMKDEEWSDVIRINLEAAFRLARAALKPMMRARFGRIISVTSVVGVDRQSRARPIMPRPRRGWSACRRRWRRRSACRGITVNCVAPGFIRSAMTEVLPEAQKEALLGRIPVGDLGTGEDIAAAAVYLASREAGYVTGQTLHVNGGMAML